MVSEGSSITKKGNDLLDASLCAAARRTHLLPHFACQTQLRIDSMTGVITDSRMLKSVSHAPAIQLYAVSDRKHASAHYRCWISGQSCKILFAFNTLLLSRQITALNHFPARSSLNSVSRAAMPQSGCWSIFLYKSALKNKSQCMCET